MCRWSAGSSFLPCIVLWWMVITCKGSESYNNGFPREFDFRYTSYEELIEQVPVFSNPNIVGFSQLTLDENNEQLLVGAQDSLFRLSLDNLNLTESADFPAKDPENCVRKGKLEDSCHNFVRVLILHNYTTINSNSDVEQAVFVCGTNAFSPVCTWRPVSNLSIIIDQQSGIGKSPYDPIQNSTTIITTDGDIYGATNIGSGDRDPAIYRSSGPKSKELRTAQSNSKWLNEPDFVSSYEIGDLVYFFFREVAVEYINCGKRIYSRVARLCKSDPGGLFENTWTTFFKSRLNCSLPGSYPFYYDEIQSTYLLDDGEEKYIYAVFSTPMNSIAGSAVCVFNHTAFKESFNGPFKYQESPRAAWERHDQPEARKLTQCPEKKDQNKRSNEKQNMDESKYQLMDNAVQPTTEMPFVHADNERWTHVVVDKVEGKKGSYNVVFVATADGKIRKLAKVGNETCLIEEIKIVPNGEHKPVKAMRISSKKMAIYISVKNQVIKVPLQRCSRFENSDLCRSSNDPYCGWDGHAKQCSPAPLGQPNVFYWVQDMNGCPFVSHPVAGGWSEWSDWATCSQVGENPAAGDCQCRSRSCDNPKPYYGGQPCIGASVEVTNCTAHGEWTEWTSWSMCSQSCGSTAIQKRQRHCTPPRFGGRACVGQDSQDQYCQGHPPCPLPPVKGNWSEWSKWSECSAKCNGGIQTRWRQCNEPSTTYTHQPQTISCVGNTQEWQMCNIELCERLFKLTPWTPWVATNHTKGGYFQERFRFKCEAEVSSDSMIKVPKLSKSQARFCFEGGQCHDSEVSLISDVDGGWSHWTEWSVCSQDCDGGLRWRSRVCDNPEPLGEGLDCDGHTMEGQQCNEHPCQGVWGCWSPLSVCSVTCGQGVLHRTRTCDSLPPGKKFIIPCEGPEDETVDCDMGPCINVVLSSASSLSDDYMKKVRFSLAQMFLVGGLSFFLGGSASLALYCYISSFRNAMKEAKQNERKRKFECKLGQQQDVAKRQSQVSVKIPSARHSQVIAEHSAVMQSNSMQESANEQMRRSNSMREADNQQVRRSNSTNSSANQQIRRSNSTHSSANQQIGQSSPYQSIGRSRFYDMDSPDYESRTIGRSKFYDTTDYQNENPEQNRYYDKIMTSSTNSTKQENMFYDQNPMQRSFNQSFGRSQFYVDNTPDYYSPKTQNIQKVNNQNCEYETIETRAPWKNIESPNPSFAKTSPGSSQISLNNAYIGKRSNCYDVENVMKDSRNKEGPFDSTLDRKCALKTFTIKDL